MNMVMTIDGKTVSGERTESVTDLGSKMDHLTMRQIETAADCVFIGAGTLRATKKIHYPDGLRRAVLTHRSDLPFESKFFEPPGLVTIFGADCPGFESVLTTNAEEIIDYLHRTHNVRTLLIEGGSEVNAHFLAADAVDEIFVTIAPRIKLGRDTPTLAGGDVLPRGSLLCFKLISAQQHENELYLHYKRNHE